jgi:hypothetical protein
MRKTTLIEALHKAVDALDIFKQEMSDDIFRLKH